MSWGQLIFVCVIWVITTAIYCWTWINAVTIESGVLDDNAKKNNNNDNE